MTTLRETAARCCKQVYIGAAVLPKPLFVPDFDDDENADGEKSNDEVVVPRRPKINCATVATVDPSDDPSLSDTAKRRPPTRYARVLSSEFNSVVIEHHLKWSPLAHSIPGPIDQSSPPATRLGRYDFHHADTMVDWAIERDVHVKGHVLVWHVTSPPMLEGMEPRAVREAVRRHIFTTMGHFRGRITMWDVVNEALAKDGTLVENVFYRKMGPNYIEECFRWAHDADPKAFLIYNDNKVEGCGSGGEGVDRGIEKADGTNETKTRRCKSKAPNQAKSDGFYNLLKDMVRKGVPVHGAGMQAHFNAGGAKQQRPPTPSMVKRQIRRIGDLGLKVNISEMDVRVSKLDADTEKRNLAQTEIYRDVLAAALSEPSFHGVWLWGFADRHTWVKNFYYDDAPLIFDEDYGRKESYRGVEEALGTIASRPGNEGEVESAICCKFLECDFDEEGNRWGRDWMAPETDD